MLRNQTLRLCNFLRSSLRSKDKTLTYALWSFTRGKRCDFFSYHSTGSRSSLTSSSNVAHHQELVKKTVSYHPYGSYTPIPFSVPLIDIHEQNVHRITDFDVYESIIYSFTSLVVSLFVSRSCTWSEVLKPQFIKRAMDYHETSFSIPSKKNGSSLQHVFLLIDVDHCPRAAYHCEITDVPSVVVMFGDDAFRKKFSPIDHYDASSVLDQAFDTIMTFDQTPLETLQSLTSNSAWFDHHIRLDNLNVHRLKWPTQ